MKLKLNLSLILPILLFSIMACFNSPSAQRNGGTEDDIPPPPSTPKTICNYFLKNVNLSKDTLKQIKILAKKAASMISENDVYDLMSQAIFPIDTIALPDTLCTKIIKRTSTFGEHLNIDLLKSLSPTYIEMTEVIFMYSQISCNETQWDCSRLKNVVCLSQNDLDVVFAKKTGEVDYSRERWKQFRKIYGKYGLHWLSRPIFNEEKDFALIEYGGTGGQGLGSGSLLIFKKIDSKWRLVETQELWIT